MFRPAIAPVFWCVSVSSSVRHSVWPRSHRTWGWLAGGLAVCATRSSNRWCRSHFMGHFVGIATPLSFSHATIVGWCIRVFLLGAPAVYRMGTYLEGPSVSFSQFALDASLFLLRRQGDIHGRVSIRFRRVSSGASSPGTHTVPHLQIHPM